MLITVDEALNYVLPFRALRGKKKKKSSSQSPDLTLQQLRKPILLSAMFRRENCLHVSKDIIGVIILGWLPFPAGITVLILIICHKHWTDFKKKKVWMLVMILKHSKLLGSAASIGNILFAFIIKSTYLSLVPWFLLLNTIVPVFTPDFIAFYSASRALLIFLLLLFPSISHFKITWIFFNYFGFIPIHSPPQRWV